jgi:Nucleolar protein,Nop52
MHYSAVRILEASHWKEEVVDGYAKILQEGLLAPNNRAVPDSLKFHTSEVFVPILVSSVTEQIPSAALAKLLHPFANLVAHAQTKQVSLLIQKNVFCKIMLLLQEKQKPVVVPQVTGKRSRKRKQTKTPVVETHSSDSEPESDSEEIELFENARKVLQIDDTLVKMIFETSVSETVPVGNRGRLYSIIRLYCSTFTNLSVDFLSQLTSPITVQ